MALKPQGDGSQGDNETGVAENRIWTKEHLKQSIFK